MSKPLPIAKRPGWRWYVAYARLRVARLLDLPTPQLIARCAALVVAAGVAISFARAELLPATTESGGIHTQQAYVQIIWMIVVLLISALISYALRPKPKTPEAAKANIPVVEDGKSAVRFYGTCWVDDPVVLAMRQLPPIPIRASGGKKG